MTIQAPLDTTLYHKLSKRSLLKIGMKLPFRFNQEVKQSKNKTRIYDRISPKRFPEKIKLYRRSPIGYAVCILIGQEAV